MKNTLLIITGLFAAVLFSGCSGTHEGLVNGTINVSGAAYGSNLRDYTIEVARADTRSNWTRIGVMLTGESGTRLNESVLANWNTSAVSDGEYVIRLTANGLDGQKSYDYLFVTVSNAHEAGECPTWSCDDLKSGKNIPEIGLTQEQYKNNMHCEIICSCPAGTYTQVHSSGDIEEGYDYLTLTGLVKPDDPVYGSYGLGEEEYPLTGNWSSYHTFGADESVNISFSSDDSNDGRTGFGGFSVPKIMCIPYCRSTSGNSDYENIAKVRLNNDTMVSESEPYVDNTENTLTDLVAGQNYTLEVDIKSANTEDCSEKAVAWIDYNQDYAFGDLDENGTPSEERINLGNYTMRTGVHKFTASFTVPADAPLGNARMRVSLKGCEKGTCYDDNETYCKEIMKGAIPRPCDMMVSFGSVNDYRIEMMRSGCGLRGDEPPCGVVGLSEVLNVIGMWQNGLATMRDVILLVDKWTESG